MKNNGKNYELIHDKTGNLDCPDCAFRNIDCSATEAVNKCNMYQVWKECAQEKETEQQSNCNLPHVSNNEVAVEPEKHKCINCGKEYEDIDDAIMCCYAPLFIYRKQYEDDLQRRQKEHLDNVYGNQNRNWRPCLHDSCPDCLGTGIKRDGGMCIHGISCPCQKCTPSY